MPPIWRPRFPVRDALDRWVVRATLNVGLRIPLEQREEIADRALEAAEEVIAEAVAGFLALEASVERDIEVERVRRQRHVEALRTKREVERLDRERGFS